MQRHPSKAGLPAPPAAGGGGAANNNKPKNTLSEIQRLQKERDERRRQMENIKNERAAEEQRNRDAGTPGDADFQRMIRQYRQEQAPAEQPHIAPGEMKIAICVRKRPISSKEIKKNDYDAVTCINPIVVVHDCKLRVDGIVKFLDNTSFEVDHTFHEENTTEEVYNYVVKPLIGFVCAGNSNRATVFAYGQTGSGKTYTMQGIHSYMVQDLYDILDRSEQHAHTQVLVSYFEIYGGRCQDLLNSRQRLNVREDGGGEVVVSDLMEVEAHNAEELKLIIDTGNRNRTTHATESNDVSSRSHAICQICLRNASTEKLVGRLSLIDLAGSERGADTMSNNRQRRLEGAEINKSLLALKECIRALDSNSSHVPYRASKLTLVLKDSFTRQSSRTVMIANVSPAASSADHTINTLRYADRIKERAVGAQAKVNNKDKLAAGGEGLSPPPPPQPSSNSQAKPASSGLTPSSRPAVQSKASKDVTPTGPSSSSRPKPVVARSESKSSAPALERADLGYELAGEDEDIDELHRTVQDLFEEEEALLNLHMNVIQENAELLTEEGRLLQQIQGDEGDIDAYATRLGNILERKHELIVILREKLQIFRKQLQREEMVAQRMSGKLRN